MARHRASDTVGGDPGRADAAGWVDQPTQHMERMPVDPPLRGQWSPSAPAGYPLPELPIRPGEPAPGSPPGPYGGPVPPWPAPPGSAPPGSVRPGPVPAADPHAGPVPAAGPHAGPVPAADPHAGPVPAAGPYAGPAEEPHRPVQQNPYGVAADPAYPRGVPGQPYPTGGAPAGPGYPPVPPPTGVDDPTGTFTRALLTGLGGEPGPPPVQPPLPRHQPAPTTPVQHVIAATRRFGARLHALRGDERTAMLAIGAVVALVILIIIALVIVFRVTADDGTARAAAATAALATAPKAARAGASTSTSLSPTASPSASPAPPAGGRFAARHSGLCLAAPVGRTDEGAQLVQRTCAADTGFLLVAKAGRVDAFSLVDAGTGRCADVAGGSDADAAAVVQWTCHGADNQVFELRELPGSGGYVQIVAEHSGKCLDVVGQSRDEGAPIQQFECRDAVTEAGYGNQSWKLIPG